MHRSGRGTLPEAIPKTSNKLKLPNEKPEKPRLQKPAAPSTRIQRNLRPSHLADDT